MPPCSRTTSGTAALVIRLWMIVAPGCRASSRAAISAVSVRRVDDRAGLVDDEAAVGVTVEGQARGRRPVSRTAACRSTRFAGSMRVGLVVGEGAVELEVERVHASAAARRARSGTVWPAMPLPASTTTVSGRMPRQVDEASAGSRA